MKNKLPAAVRKNRLPWARYLGLPLMLTLCGCEGIQSTLDPKGPHAAAIADIWWVMFFGAIVILVLVTALALYAFSGRRRERQVDGNHWILAGGVALPVVTLTALLVYGVHTMSALRADVANAERIEVTAHQWWWEVRYMRGDETLAVGANEIRIPAGRPVTVELRSNDVIHSFWVPNLAGKIDAIPGRVNRLVLHADAPGTSRGQCAEYCGAQHARMAFHVIAQEPRAHAQWLDRQRAPAAAPAGELAQLGQRHFAQHCMACHTVRGQDMTRPDGAGPDLTHLASRDFIAGGTLENNHANLLAFITDSQAIKPGSLMPSYKHLDENTLAAIARYLEGLQ